jgi:hypothetical protein
MKEIAVGFHMRYSSTTLSTTTVLIGPHRIYSEPTLDGRTVTNQETYR